MADAYVTLPDDAANAGRKVQTYRNSVGGETVDAHALVLVDETGTPIATLPVSAAALPLPSGAATAAAQATLETDVEAINTRLGEVQAAPTANTVLDRLKTLATSLASLLSELQLKADLTETQPVSAAALPLPSGAATAAGQLPDGHEVEVNNLPSEYPLPAAQVSTLTPPAAITGFALETGGNLADIKTALQIIDDWDESDRCKVSLPATAPVVLKSAAIAASSSGDNTVVSAVADKKITVVAFALSFNDAVNAKFKSASTDKTGLFYGTQYAGAGASINPPSFLFQGGTNEALIVNLSDAVAVGGFVTYYEA